MNRCEFTRHWFEQLWCNQQAATIDEMMSPDVRMHGLAPGQTLGREDFRAFYRHFRALFPDIQVKVTEAIEQDDRVAIHASVTGHHAATGTPITASGCSMARIVDGQIVETWECWDLLSILVQLGEVPETKAAILFGTTD